MSGPSRGEGVSPAAEGSALLFRQPPSNPEQSIEMAMAGRRLLVGSGDPFDEALERAKATRAVQRAWYPVGTGRQLLAIIAAKPRLERLHGVRVPMLGIHGMDHLLVPIDNGRMVPAAVPGASMLALPGMGHDIPKRVWPQDIDAVVQTAGQTGVL